jgi:hypothetical protein
MASSIGGILSFVLVWSSYCWMRHWTGSVLGKCWWAVWRWFTKKPKHVKACANNKCNLITLGGVNEVVLIVSSTFVGRLTVQKNLQFEEQLVLHGGYLRLISQGSWANTYSFRDIQNTFRYLSSQALSSWSDCFSYGGNTEGRDWIRLKPIHVKWRLIQFPELFSQIELFLLYSLFFLQITVWGEEIVGRTDKRMFDYIYIWISVETYP